MLVFSEDFAYMLNKWFEIEVLSSIDALAKQVYSQFQNHLNN